MHLPHRLLVAAAVSLALVTAACGDDDTTEATDSGDADRTVEITMVDTAFEPDSIEVAAGETVRFVFTNDGDLAHDAFIGDAAAQADHEQQMRMAEQTSTSGMTESPSPSGMADHTSTSGMDQRDGEMSGDSAVTVKPGDTAELTYTFDKAGTVQIGCHQPGHYDAGMKIDVEVA